MTYNSGLLRLIDSRVAQLVADLGVTARTAVGTVVEVVSPTRAMVAFDGSALAVRVKVDAGTPIAAGDRVGLIRYGADWSVSGSFTNRRLIARGKRTTDSTAAAARTGVLRLDNVPVSAGRVYSIRTGSLILRSSVANDQAAAVFTFTTDGTTAGTASPLLAVAYTPALASTSNGMCVVVSAIYAPAVDATLSVLLSSQRIVGTGNVQIATQSFFDIDLIVEDIGLDVGDTGVDL